jgi:hypothetical protein
MPTTQDKQPGRITADVASPGSYSGRTPTKAGGLRSYSARLGWLNSLIAVVEQ